MSARTCLLRQLMSATEAARRALALAVVARVLGKTRASRLDAHQPPEDRVLADPAVDLPVVVADLIAPVLGDRLDDVQIVGPADRAQHHVADLELVQVDRLDRAELPRLDPRPHRMT